MKLELKHLAPYLPYGLKLLYENSKGEHIKIDLVTAHFTNEWTPNFHSKPILRPLSEAINQYQEVQGHESYCDTWEEWFSHLDDFEGKLGEANILACPYDLMQVLLEKHIDVFGLIDEGLAIDINNLEI